MHSTPPDQALHGVSKTVLSFSRAHPEIVDLISNFRNNHFPSATFDLYEGSVKLQSRTKVITVRRSREDLELVVDLRLRCGSWKSSTVKGASEITAAIESLKISV